MLNPAYLQALAIFGPIFGLILLGLLVSLRSGGVSLSSPQGLSRLASNLSRLLLRLVGYVAGLLAVQQFIGFPLELGW